VLVCDTGVCAIDPGDLPDGKGNLGSDLNCPICESAADGHAVILPTASVLFSSAATLAFFPSEPSALHAEVLSHAWQGRAPPTV